MTTVLEETTVKYVAAALGIALLSAPAYACKECNCLVPKEGNLQECFDVGCQDSVEIMVPGTATTCQSYIYGHVLCCQTQYQTFNTPNGGCTVVRPLTKALLPADSLQFSDNGAGSFGPALGSSPSNQGQ